MSGTSWALITGLGFGLFQSINRRGVSGMSVYLSTFIQLVTSLVVLGWISLATEDFSALLKAPLSATLNFAAAGFFHFFIGYRFEINVIKISEISLIPSLLTMESVGLI